MFCYLYILLTQGVFNCFIACSSGYYGLNCNNTCGLCRDQQACDHINGTCLTGCEPGFTGELCITGKYIQFITSYLIRLIQTNSRCAFAYQVNYANFVPNIYVTYPPPLFKNPYCLLHKILEGCTFLALVCSKFVKHIFMTAWSNRLSYARNINVYKYVCVHA